MIRIGICDDMLEARQGLHTALDRLLQSRAIESTIYEFSSGEGLLNWIQKHAGEIDLVFLDIEMRGIDGMETAKQLHAQDTNLLIAFVTGFTEYVYDGYAVRALGYVLKPPKLNQLEELLNRALGILCCEVEETFLCQNREGIYRIPKNTIQYFYSDKRLVTCVTDKRQYSFYAKLDDIATQMDATFVRIHQRYLVCASAVEKIEANMVYIGQDKLPISRAYQTSAIAALSRAMLHWGG